MQNLQDLVRDPLRALLMSSPQLAASTAQPSMQTLGTPEEGPPPGTGFDMLRAALGQLGGPAGLGQILAQRPQPMDERWGRAPGPLGFTGGDVNPLAGSALEAATLGAPGPGAPADEAYGMPDGATGMALGEEPGPGAPADESPLGAQALQEWGAYPEAQAMSLGAEPGAPLDIAGGMALGEEGAPPPPEPLVGQPGLIEENPLAGTPLAAATALPQMPTPPEIDESSLYPSMRQSLYQALIPAIGAIVAGMAGGKAGAAGALQGANVGLASANRDLQQRGVLRYQKAQQQYAREVALYNQQWTRAQQRMQVLAQLSVKAQEFDDPVAARSWLQTQRKIYAPLGIDPMDAMLGENLPGQQRKIEAAALSAYDTHAKQIRAGLPEGETITTEQLNKNYSVTFRGKRMTMGELARQGGGPELAAGAPEGTTSLKTDANAIFKDYVDAYREQTGKEPDALVRAELRVKALEDHAAATRKPDDELDKQIKKARLALIGLQSAKARASLSEGTGGSDALAKLNPAQMRYGTQVQNHYEKMSHDFNLRGQAFDTVQALVTGRTAQSDIALVFAWMKMLDPTSTVREGEQAQARNAAGVPEIWRNLYNRALTGVSLTEKQRQDIGLSSTRLYASLSKGQQMLFDNAAAQLRSQNIAPGLYLTPQGSVNDTNAYHTMKIEGETKPLPEAAHISTARTPTPKPAPAAPAAAPARAPAAAPAAAPSTARPAKGSIVTKNGKTYRVVGYDAAGRMQAEEVTAAELGF